MNLKRDKETIQLFEAILSLQDKNDYYNFFTDLCTVDEIITFSKRLEVARQLTEDLTYLNIIDDIGVSSVIVSRIKKCMEFGEGGYMLVLERLYGSKERG